MDADVLKRIENHVERIPWSGCWIWLASVRRDGYARMNHNGVIRKVSHVVYEQFKGPRGALHVLHSCDVRLCVNPGHLSLGTHAENMRQRYERTGMSGVAKSNADKTHCIRGHPLSSGNLYVTPQGARVCRICARDKSLRHYHKQKEQSCQTKA